MAGYILLGFGVGVAASTPALTGAVIGNSVSNTFSLLAALALIAGTLLVVYSNKQDKE